MSQAEMLLKSLYSEEESDELDTTLVIDDRIRTITIPKGVTNLGVEYDSDVHRLQFEMPRMCGTTDLSTFNIRINYINANDEGDIYVVTDKQVNPSTITFSWLVGAHAVAYKGSVKFIVCLKESDSEGTILREFNTTVATLPVLEGLEVDASPLEGELSDVLEQLRSLTVAKVAKVEAEGAAQILKVQEESSKQQSNVVEKGKEVLATIPEDYQTTTKLANEGVRTKADAIACEVSGESIVLKDSSDDHIRGLNLFGKSTQFTTTGKNLLKHSSDVGSHTNKGITFDIREDGSVVCSGVAEMPTTLSFEPYFLTEDIIVSGCPANGSTQTYRITVDTYKDDAYARTEFDFGSGITIHKSRTDYVKVNIYFYTGIEGNGLVFYPMIRLASVTDSTYEPYTGGKPAPNPDYPQEIVSVENPEVCVCGKNLLDVTKADLIVVGASGSKRYGIIFDKLGTYTFSCKTEEGIAVKVVTNGKYGDYLTLVGNVSHTFTLAENQYLIVYQGSEGKQFIAGLEDPQIEQGDIATAYEPYKASILPTVHTLHGIPVTSGGNYTDSDGQQWICDEIDLERGVHVQRIGSKEFDGSEDEKWFVRNETPVIYYTAISDKRVNYEAVPNALLCSHFPVAPHMDGYQTECITETYYRTGNINILINYNNGVGGLDGFVEYLHSNPITVKYILKTPIETPLTADEIAAFKELRTNLPNTTILNDAGAWMSVKYNADTKTYVENPKVLKLVDSSTGVVYELKIVDGNLTVNPV